MRFAAEIVDRIPGFNTLSGLEAVDEFAGLMTNQLNLINEADNLVRLQRNFQESKAIGFPQPIFPFATTNALVESFCEGILVSELFNGDVQLRADIAKLGLHAILKMIFDDNFIHAGK